MEHRLFVLSGPSGVGKGTIAKILKERGLVELSVSCTTREPRKGEIDKKDYFFISKAEFVDKIEANGFLEYSEHFENYYGTPKDFVIETLKANDVLLEIDVNGGLKVRENYPSAVLIMLLPPSVIELKARLIGRNTETPDKVEERLSRLEYELSKQDLYDYKVINGDLNKAVEEIENIIKG